MIKQWYYVSSGERIGPVSDTQIEQFIRDSKIDQESYLWTKGFANWTKLKDIKEFKNISVEKIEKEILPPILDIPKISYDWNDLNEDEKIVTIKIGIDRDSSETEYGPYSIKELKLLYKDQRINGKSLVFIPGEENWQFLSEIPISSQIMGEGELEITEQDRRLNVRKPFVARMFFHDTKKVYEGMCRDISIGGMQILVSDFPCEVGHDVEMNIHPENAEFGFVAAGVIVRILDGNQGFCIRFGQLNDRASQSIMKYVDQM